MYRAKNKNKNKASRGSDRQCVGTNKKLAEKPGEKNDFTNNITSTCQCQTDEQILKCKARELNQWQNIAQVVQCQ